MRAVWGASAAAGTAAGLALLLAWLAAGPPGGFVQIADGLWRFQHRHVFQGAFGWTVEVNTFLVVEGDSGILVDAGPPDDPLYPPQLVRAVKQALGPASLQLVLLTHGHQDHTSGLAAVFEQWPAVQLAFHKLEHPFLTEAIDPSNIPSNYSKHWIWLYQVSPAATPERVLHFQGSQGDVSRLSSPAGLPVHWRPPEGLLTWRHVPGHAPGQVVLLHRRSRMLLAGDLFYHIATKQGEPPQLSRLPPGLHTVNPVAVQSIKETASALDFDRAWVAHDAGSGVPAAAFKAWAAELNEDS